MKKTLGLIVLSFTIAAAAVVAIHTNTATAAGVAAVENWPQWRGPNLDGIGARGLERLLKARSGRSSPRLISIGKVDIHVGYHDHDECSIS